MASRLISCPLKQLVNQRRSNESTSLTLQHLSILAKTPLLTWIKFAPAGRIYTKVINLRNKNLSESTYWDWILIAEEAFTCGHLRSLAVTSLAVTCGHLRNWFTLRRFLSALAPFLICLYKLVTSSWSPSEKNVCLRLMRSSSTSGDDIFFASRVRFRKTLVCSTRNDIVEPLPWFRCVWCQCKKKTRHRHRLIISLPLG